MRDKTDKDIFFVAMKMVLHHRVLRSSMEKERKKERERERERENRRAVEQWWYELYTVLIYGQVLNDIVVVIILLRQQRRFINDDHTIGGLRQWWKGQIDLIDEVRERERERSWEREREREGKTENRSNANVSTKSIMQYELHAVFVDDKNYWG